MEKDCFNDPHRVGWGLNQGEEEAMQVVSRLYLVEKREKCLSLKSEVKSQKQEEGNGFPLKACGNDSRRMSEKRLKDG